MLGVKVLNQIEKRLGVFRKEIAEKGMDAAVIEKRESYIYLSGFTGTSAYLLITQYDAFLFTDFRYFEQAQKQAVNYEIIQYQNNVYEEINSLMKEKGIRVLGFEGNYVSYDGFGKYKKYFNIDEMRPVGDIVEVQRSVKDEAELELIKQAVAIADKAFEHVLPYLKPGVSELEIAAELEYNMKKNGASGPSFETIVASGARAAMPHGVASEKKLEAGDVITMDFGAIYKNYCSDITRTVFLGQPNQELKKIYNIVLDAQLRAIEGAHEGLQGIAVDSIARNYIAEHGYGDNFGHGLGHGVGLEIHEKPTFSKRGNMIIKNNMVVTVEPGIYVNGLGGVRIEDIIVINGDKPEILTGASKEMIVL